MRRERRWDVLGVGDTDIDLFLSAPRLPGRDEKVLGRFLGEYPGGVVANFCCAASLRALAGDDELAGARALLAKGARVVAVTMGARGCLIVTGDETIRLPAHAVAVTDTTGAGDCFNGTFVSGYLRGWDLERCGRIASAAAAISVTHVGSRSSLPTLERVERFIAPGGAQP